MSLTPDRLHSSSTNTQTQTSPVRHPNLLKNDSNSLLKSSFRPRLKPSLSSDPNLKHHNNPRTSMSQLKLMELYQEKQGDKNQEKFDDLESFGLKELRDGFFDPVYRKPIKVPNDDEDDHIFRFRVRLFFQRIRKFVQASHVIKSIKTIYTSSLTNWRILTKFTLAYFISLILSVIHESNNWFGPYVVFLPVSTLINHPVHSIGTQIEITLQSIVGIAIGLGWGSLTLYISTATQPTINHQGGILSSSLFLGVFFMGWLKSYFLRFYYMLLSSGLALIFLTTCLDPISRDNNWKNAWNFAIPYLFGLLVSLVVSILYFPYRGHERTISHILKTTQSIKDLLIAFTEVDSSSEPEIISSLQKHLISDTLLLSDTFRDFLSGMKISFFKDSDLKTIRNHLNFIAAPLRVIPSVTNIYHKKEITAAVTTNNSGSNVATSVSGLNNVSGITTPLPKSHMPHNLITQHPKFGYFNGANKLIYLSIVDDNFNQPLFKLLHQMVESVYHIEDAIKSFNNFSKSHDKKSVLETLDKSKISLKRRVRRLDITYKEFSKTDYFSRELLSEEAVIDVFLFLRYSRQAATMILYLIDVMISSCESVHGMKLLWPNYPWKRSLRRLPRQCLKDQGADSVFHYFETKIDVDDAFERIYNVNTSRTKKSRQHDSSTANIEASLKPIRAIDHNDFSLHSSKSTLRYKLWKLSKKIDDIETKYAFKVSFIVVFLALPGWLKDSWGWFNHYHSFWSPLLVFFFLSPRNSGTWENLSTRTLCWFIGCFFGWASNQAKHFQSPYIVVLFGTLLCLMFSFGFLVEPHPRSSLIAILSYTIVSLTTFTNALPNTGDIFKTSWTVSLAVYIGSISSMISNWIIWPFIARVEIYKSCSSLLSHIAQSYQSVSERYLYRDEDDDPTDLTLELANIREVRMSQSLQAVKELLTKAQLEHDFTHTFKPRTFERILESCDLILEKIIEARMSGVYFRVWEQDVNEEGTKELLSIRRDSVATVVYLLYIISNSFRLKSHIPNYLPSAISIRKRLYDSIAALESKFEEEPTVVEQLNEKLSKIATEASSDTNNGQLKDSTVENYNFEKTHWTEVHGMAFSRAFTSITKELENLVILSKELLGEENLLE